MSCHCTETLPIISLNSSILLSITTTSSVYHCQMCEAEVTQSSNIMSILVYQKYYDMAKMSWWSVQLVSFHSYSWIVSGLSFILMNAAAASCCCCCCCESVYTQTQIAATACTVALMPCWLWGFVCVSILTCLASNVIVTASRGSGRHILI